MYAIRQIQTIENGQVIVQLPDDFPATQVEVIILPVPATDADTTEQEPIESVFQRFLSLNKTNFTDEQQLAYQRACMILRKGRQPHEPRVFALFTGLVSTTADFDEPLPDEIIDLFYGSATEEYGLSLPQ
ncbi:MAG: hypothetical protein U0350_01795 [Caldilineaceae bacterium]